MFTTRQALSALLAAATLAGAACNKSSTLGSANKDQTWSPENLSQVKGVPADMGADIAKQDLLIGLPGQALGEHTPGEPCAHNQIVKHTA